MVVPKWEWAELHWTVHWRMVKMVSLVLCTFCHNWNHPQQWRKTRSLGGSQESLSTFQSFLTLCVPPCLSDSPCATGHLFIHPSWVGKFAQWFLRGKWVDFIQRPYLKGWVLFLCVSPVVPPLPTGVFSYPPGPWFPLLPQNARVWRLAPASSFQLMGTLERDTVAWNLPRVFLYLLLLGGRAYSPILFFLHSKTCV